MQGIGFEGFARVTFGDPPEGAGAREVNGQRAEKNEDGEQTGFDVNGVKEQAVEGLDDDVNRGEDEKTGFDKGGKVFELAVAVGMALVGGPVRDAHREKGDDCRDKVEAGVQGFGEDAEAVCANDQEGFQTEQERGRTDAEEGGALLFLDGRLLAAGKHHEIKTTTGG